MVGVVYELLADIYYSGIGTGGGGAVGGGAIAPLFCICFNKVCRYVIA